MIKKCAIYVRCSTNKQEVDYQIKQLNDYCEKSGWKIYKHYIDTNFSGRLKSRPEFDKLFNDAHKKLFDIVLFWDISRFSRSGMRYTVQKLTEINHLGLEWVSYQEKYLNTMNEFSRDIVLSVLSGMAKMEAEKISERTKSALEIKKLELEKKGKRLGRPSVPDYAVKEIDELLKQNMSMRKISKQVSYKVKYGGVRHPSIGFICTRKQYLCSKKGC